MPIKIKYSDNEIGVLYIGEGIVSGDDIIISNRKTFSSIERMKTLKYCLVDYSNIAQFNVSNSEVEIIVSQEKEASEYILDGVIAVVSNKDIAFGINRMWETLFAIEGLQWETNVFRAIEDAKAWIKERVKAKYGIDDLTFG
jgi:hypothetical protein